jgi:uncharacterized protein YndB with AHSA1/START domain
MKRLFVEKSISIAAPVEKVWKILTDGRFAGQWIEEGWEKIGGESMNIYSDWKPGSEVLWKNEQGKLMVKGNVTKVNPYKLLRFTVFDVNSTEKISAGEEDGITYSFTEQNGSTILSLRHGDFLIMKDGEKYYGQTNKVWDGALPKIKELAEANDDIDSQPSCGKGLADNSVLPARFSELIDCLAENLELHLNSLDLNDDNARREYETYIKLANKHRNLARELMGVAIEMYNNYDLPMAKHDEEKLSDPKMAEAFKKFTNLEHEIIATLRKQLKRDEKILETMPQCI